MLSVILALTCSSPAPGQDGEAHRADWRDAYRRPGLVPYPENNPYTLEKAKLGEALFFDPVLSGDRTLACVSCHLPSLAWGDGLPRAVGVQRQTMDLRSPTLLDLAWMPRLGWDGKFQDIESVTFRAIAGATNMNLSTKEVLERLSGSPAYVRRFQLAFGRGPITQEKVEHVLATYERGILSDPAPFDRWIEGDPSALNDAQKRGFALFETKAGCTGCHSGWAFTDYSFQDIGTATGNDLGRGALFPSSVALRYAFKVPTLRDIVRRAPYMHDGSIATLSEIIELYDRGGIERPSRSSKIRPLGLNEHEKADLIAFLNTLTGASRQVLPPLPLR